MTSQERIGEAVVLFQAVIWSSFPVLAVISLQKLAPITSLAWVTLLALMFFSLLGMARRSWINPFQRSTIGPLSVVVLINGILFYALYFYGLTQTSPGNAGIIATLEVLFSFLYFNVWKKEYITTVHIAGIICMLLSAIIILAPAVSGIHYGDFLILIAVALVPAGNQWQKHLRTRMASEQILLYRTLFAVPVLFALAYALHGSIVVPANALWAPLLIIGFLLFGFTKVLWIEGIHRIGVTKSIALASIAPIFTLLFSYILLGERPTSFQLIAVPLAVLGVYFLTRLPSKDAAS